MCGIGAIFGKSSQLKEELTQSLSKITHRGQNLYEMKVFESAAIGANRLAIVDQQNGRQPFSNEKNTIFVVQNGEIFNYKALKTELEKKGHRFKTDCDTEVLVHLWEEFGPKMVQKIDSEMYAFVIYDSKKDEYFICRDPLGLKPLYYAHDSENRFHVASEIKQLAQFPDITEIHEFPAGTFYYQDKFQPYFDTTATNQVTSKTKALQKLKTLFENAVKKRVQTDLPIGVFLSGGVDSSLLMELATRHHSDITAIILGAAGSADREAAVRLCEEKKYKYKIVEPAPITEEEIEQTIYYLESFEPLIVRQAIANHMVSKAAAELGLKIVLVGEGIDELFAGYNEFSHLSAKNVNKGCELLTKSLPRGHHMRVDKQAMRHTIEVRAPFFDTTLVRYALTIDGKLKIQKKDHRITTKAIFRDLASAFVPEYIAQRFKAPFANGAGMDVGFNYKAEDGALAKIAHKYMSAQKLKQIQKKYSSYQFTTREEAYYFEIYQKFRYDKFSEGRYRLMVKDNLSTLEDNRKGTRLLVGEFDRVPEYFPAYLAAKLGYFKKNGLNVDFIATGGDDKTYAALIQNSAQIGMADPMFAMIENPYSVKGEIIGELIQSPSLAVVTFKKDLQINKLEDLDYHTIVTYEPLSTTHMITSAICPHASILSIHHSEIEQAFSKTNSDAAIVQIAIAHNLESKGAKILFYTPEQIPHFLFTGFTVSQNLEPRYRNALPAFLQSIQDALQYIHQNPTQAFRYFKQEFPRIKQSQKTFDHLFSVWPIHVKVQKADWEYALHYWRKQYAHLLTQINPFFLQKTKEEEISSILANRNFSRNPPYMEIELLHRIKDSVSQQIPIPLVGFWGASNKTDPDASDKSAIEQLKALNEKVKQVYSPGLRFTFILADEHARLNGYQKEEYSQYLEQIQQELQSISFNCIYLSEIWNRNKLSAQIIQNAALSKPKNWWNNHPIREQLETQAQKRGHQNTVIGAQHYAVMRELEIPILEKEFAVHIFWAFSNPASQPLFPHMPTLYLFSSNKRTSDAPWFK